MSDIIVRAEGLGKKYSLRHEKREKYVSLRDVITSKVSHLKRKLISPDISNFQSQEEFWALKDVSFEIKRGDCVGIIGSNGAGKSTLLKILSRITEPTEGFAELHGRVASLLEVGTGFHPELTGRENIYLNGEILGMRKLEIRRRFDEIVAFAEVDRFLDTPVKRYSSGMYVRLAFAVAAHLEPEILVVDEILAVGDAQFQKKCLGKIGDVGKEGRTVLFVSHNMNALSTLCESAIFLESGQVIYKGEATSTIEKYLTSHSENKKHSISHYRNSSNLSEIFFQSIELDSENSQIPFKERLIFEFSIKANKPMNNISIGGTIFNSMGNPVGAFVSRELEFSKNEIKRIKLKIGNFNLAPGFYHTGFSLGKGRLSNTNRFDCDVVVGYPRFEILPFNNREKISAWSSDWGNIILNDYVSEEVLFEELVLGREQNL